MLYDFEVKFFAVIFNLAASKGIAIHFVDLNVRKVFLTPLAIWHHRHVKPKHMLNNELRKIFDDFISSCSL